MSRGWAESLRSEIRQAIQESYFKERDFSWLIESLDAVWLNKFIVLPKKELAGQFAVFASYIEARVADKQDRDQIIIEIKAFFEFYDEIIGNRSILENYQHDVSLVSLRNEISDMSSEPDNQTAKAAEEVDPEEQKKREQRKAKKKRNQENKKKRQAEQEALASDSNNAKDKEVLAEPLVNPSTDLEKKFFSSLSSCINSRGEISIDDNYQKLSYKFRLGAFSQLLGENVNLDHMTPQILGLVATLVLPEVILQKKGADNLGDDFEAFTTFVDNMILQLFTAVMKRDDIDVDNAKEWVAHVQFSDHFAEISAYVAFLYSSTKVTDDNFAKWLQIFSNESKKAERGQALFVSSVVQYGLEQKAITPENLAKISQLYIGQFCSKHEFARIIISGLHIHSEIPLYNIGEWYNKLSEVLCIKKCLLADFFIACYNGLEIKNHQSWQANMPEMVMIIAMHKVMKENPALHQQIQAIMQNNPRSIYLKSFVVRFFFAKETTMDQVIPVAKEMLPNLILLDKCLLLINDIFSFLSDEKMNALTTTLNNADKCVTESLHEYIKAKSLVRKYLNGEGVITDDIDHNIAQINKLIEIFTFNRDELFSELFEYFYSKYRNIDFVSEFYRHDMIDKNLFFYLCASKAVTKGVINLSNFKDWFDQVKELDFNVLQYSVLYNYLVNGIKECNQITMKDLRLWHDEIRLAFFLIDGIKTELSKAYNSSDDSLDTRTLIAGGNDITHLLLYHFHDEVRFVGDIILQRALNAKIIGSLDGIQFCPSILYLKSLSDYTIVQAEQRLGALIRLAPQDGSADGSQREQSDKISLKFIHDFIDNHGYDLTDEQIELLVKIDASKIIKILNTKLTDLPDRLRREGYFKLLAKSITLVYASNLCKEDESDIGLELNKIFIIYAIDNDFIAPDTKALERYRLESFLEYSTVIDNLFGALLQDDDLKVDDFNKWMDVCCEFLPDGFTISKNIDDQKDEEIFIDNRAHLFGLCMGIMKNMHQCNNDKVEILYDRYLNDELSTAKLYIAIAILGLDEEGLDFLIEEDVDSEIVKDVESSITKNPNITKGDIVALFKGIECARKDYISEQSIANPWSRGFNKWFCTTSL